MTYPYTRFLEAQPITLAEVLNGIALPVTLPTPVAGLFGVRPHPEAIPPAAPGTGAGVFTAMGAGDLVEQCVTPNQIEDVHRPHLLARE
jgi:hypothetical protein